eukprot:scaffold17867_cov101-Isochrysis_galbana.AAC.1
MCPAAVPMRMCLGVMPLWVSVMPSAATAVEKAYDCACTFGGSAAKASNWLARSDVSTGPASSSDSGSSATEELTKNSADVSTGWEAEVYE